MALLRQSGLPATSTIWAEDGRIFYAQALRMSFWQTLVTPHDGYGQLFPRAVVQVARLAAPGQAAEILAIAGAFSMAAIACLVFHMARGHVASRALRALLVAAIVLLPVASAELLDNVVNVPWWLFFASFWALLWRPCSATGRASAGLVCFLAAASEPLVGLFLPLSVARALALRNARDQAPTAGIVSGLLYQALVMVRSSSNVVSSAGSLQGLAQSFSVRVGLGLAGGEKGTDWLFVHELPIAVGLGAVVACSLLVLGVFFSGSLRVRVFTLAAASFCCGLLPGAGLAARAWAHHANSEGGGCQPLSGGACPAVGEHHIGDRRRLGEATHRLSRWLAHRWNQPRGRPGRSHRSQLPALALGDGRGALRLPVGPGVGGGLPGLQPTLGRAGLGHPGRQGDRSVPAGADRNGFAGDRPPRVGRLAHMRGPGHRPPPTRWQGRSPVARGPTVNRPVR